MLFLPVHRQIPAETQKTAPGNCTSCRTRDDFLSKTISAFQPLLLFKVLVLVRSPACPRWESSFGTCMHSDVGPFWKRIQIFHLIPVSIQEVWPQSPPQLCTTNAKPHSHWNQSRYRCKRYLASALFVQQHSSNLQPPAAILSFHGCKEIISILVFTSDFVEQKTRTEQNP